VTTVELSYRSGDLDPALWFPCVHHEGARDIFYASAGNTFRGRLPAWCEHREVSFRVSLNELPDDLPESTVLWVRGFLAGCVPRLDDDTDLDARTRQVDTFLTTGTWPHD